MSPTTQPACLKSLAASKTYTDTSDQVALLLHYLQKRQQQKEHFQVDKLLHKQAKLFVSNDSPCNAHDTITLCHQDVLPCRTIPGVAFNL